MRIGSYINSWIFDDASGFYDNYDGQVATGDGADGNFSWSSAHLYMLYRNFLKPQE
ncbi:hypothetical protein [Aeromonas jandaei]|uniref:hypothetical protein n=1 Tax=Aeromonas jandaei TaxID=650 RepID=UPI003BA1C7A6